MISSYRPMVHRRKPERIGTTSSTNSSINDGLGSIVKIFRPSEIIAPLSSDPAITDFKTVTSYSWLKSIHPTIIVPGCPTLYKGFRSPLTVKGDAGLQIVDNASTLLPDAPLLPLYEAVRRVEPDHDFDQYDIVTNRGELKKILSWILGEQKKEFRIEIETAGESRLLFRRWENQEFRPAGAQYYGRYAAPTVHYRNNFEQSTCFPVKGNEDAFSHVRVVAYNFVGLHLSVQCEVDGFMLDDDAEGVASEICADKPRESLNDLAEELSKLGLKNSKAQSKTAASVSPLLVLPYHGFEVGHEHLIELKTRSMKNPCPLLESEVYAQVVWSGTPTTINAVHRQGTFEIEEIYKLSEMEKMRETRLVREGMKRVGVLLKEVIALLKEKPAGSKYCLICRGPGEKELFLKEGGRGAGLRENKGGL